MRDIHANDVISQHFGTTIREISIWEVKQGSGNVSINAWALKEIAQEILCLWDSLSGLKKQHKNTN